MVAIVTIQVQTSNLQYLLSEPESRWTITTPGPHSENEFSSFVPLTQQLSTRADLSMSVPVCRDPKFFKPVYLELPRNLTPFLSAFL